MDDIEGRIIHNKEIASRHYLLKITLEKSMDPIVPGQFVMLQIPDNDIFLRRPFSIYDYHQKTLSLLYKVVGKGTESLSRKVKNTKVFRSLSPRQGILNQKKRWVFRCCRRYRNRWSSPVNKTVRHESHYFFWL